MKGRILNSIIAAAGGLVMTASIATAEPVQFQLDRSHAHIGFEIGHFGFSPTIGRFNDYKGTFVIDEKNPEKSKINVVIQAASIDTNHKARDAHLRNPDFFNVEKFPTLTFASTKITMIGRNQGKVTGDFTMHGVTKPVTLDFVWTDDAPFPANQVRTIGFKVKGQIKRSEYGMTTYVGLPIGDEVDLTMNFDIVQCDGEAAKSPQCTY